MKKLFFRCLFFLLCVVLSSCGNNKKVVNNIDPISLEISKHKASADAVQLINYCYNYPNYAEEIRPFLLFDIDYSNYSDNQLQDLVSLAYNDSLLRDGFERLLITRHQKRGNIDALIEDAKQFPTSRDVLRNYLLFIYNYSSYSYKQLCRLREKSEWDPILEQGYYAKVLDFENRTLLSLKEKPLKEVLSYYKSNVSELPFLETFISSSVIGNLSDYDYKHIRSIRKMLVGTSHSALIEPIYISKRNNHKSAVTTALSQQKKDEEIILNQLKHYLDDTLKTYLCSHVAEIIRQCGRKEYSSDHSKVQEQFYEILNRNLSVEYMKSLAYSRYDELEQGINNSRSAFYLQLTGEQLNHGLTSFAGVESNRTLNNNYNLSGLYEIADIQNEFDVTGAVISAASFLLGFGFLASAAASAVHSYSKGSEDANKEGEALRRFAKDLMPKLLQTQNAIVSDIMTGLRNRESTSFTEFEKTVYETY